MTSSFVHNFTTSAVLWLRRNNEFDACHTYP